MDDFSYPDLFEFFLADSISYLVSITYKINRGDNLQSIFSEPHSILPPHSRGVAGLKIMNV